MLYFNVIRRSFLIIWQHGTWLNKLWSWLDKLSFERFSSIFIESEVLWCLFLWSSSYVMSGWGHSKFHFQTYTRERTSESYAKAFHLKLTTRILISFNDFCLELQNDSILFLMSMTWAYFICLRDCIFLDNLCSFTIISQIKYLAGIPDWVIYTFSWSSNPWKVVDYSNTNEMSHPFFFRS